MTARENIYDGGVCLCVNTENSLFMLTADRAAWLMDSTVHVEVDVSASLYLSLHKALKQHFNRIQT